ncbi:MAG: CHASE2 domain-containing protein, partial [Cyanobacteria bacterium J06641_5]
MRKVLLWGRGAPLSFLLSALLVGGLRAAGLLQGSEWWAYDRFLRSLPMPTEEPRVTVVGITETDVNTYRYPIDDRTLARALENILASNPRGVGIVLLRDLPVPPGNAKLRALLAKSPPLVGSTFIGGIENESIPPPPTLPEQQVGAVDLIGDGDGVLRRTQLYPGGTPAMGLKLALNYLAAEGIVDRASPNGWLQLGDLEVVPLRPNSGPYSKAQTPGTQIFLPYQGLEKRFTTISLQQAIEGNFDPAIFQGRVVLLGPTAASIDAGFFTPYTRDLTRISPPKMAGVFIHAQVAAGLLEAVLGDRQLLRVFPDPLEYFWIFAIGGIQFGALLFWREAKLQFALPGFALNALALSGATWAIARYAFTVGWWIPVAPPLAIVWICALTGTIGNLISRLLNYQQQLQRHLIEQEQTAVLGELASSLGHEIRGSLNQILQEASVLRFLFEYSIPSLAEVDAASADNALQITELNVQHIDTMLQAILNPNVEGITVLNPLVDEVCTVIAHHFNARE